MSKVSFSILTGLILVACGKNTSALDAEIASVGQSSLTVECVRNVSGARTTSFRDSLVLKISGKSVALERRLTVSKDDTSDVTTQKIQGTINSVFDFNSISKESIRVLLNPTSMTTSQMSSGEKSVSPLPYVLIQYSQGQLKVTERDAKVVLSHSICRTKS